MSSLVHSNLTEMPALQTRLVGKSLYCFDETDSTNNHALASQEDGAVFVAETQSAGRGRLGRRWHSAPELGLWFSVALPGPIPGLTFAAALAIRDAVADEAPLSLKWPNDLYHGRRKLCGILVEQRNQRTALGIGLNVNHQVHDFPAAMRHRIGSLAIATNKPWDRTLLFWKLLHYLDDAVMRLYHGELDQIRDEWLNACDIIGRRIRRGGVSGIVADLDNEGALLVRTAEGIKRVTCGDVTVLGYYSA